MEYLLICLLCCLVSVHANTGFGLPAASPVAHVNDVLDGLAAEIALFGAKLQRIALKVDANMPISRFDHTFSRHHVHDRRSRVHTRGMAHPAAVLEQAPGSLGLVLPDTTSVAFTELRLKGHTLNIFTLKNDEFVGATIRKKKVPFQQDLLGVLMDLIPSGSTVVDAGANIGMFSAFFAAAVGPNGHVYSFEPQLRVYEMLCTNMIVNSLLHIVPKNLALSYKPDILQMTAKVVDGVSGGQELTAAEKSGKPVNYGGMRLGQGGEEVRAITLDSLNLHNVSLIKVDVQGAEQLMFYGARDTIRRNMPVIAYENMENAMAQRVSTDLSLPDEVRTFDFAKFLRDLGYTPFPASKGKFGRGDTVMLPPGNYMLKEIREVK